MCRQLIDEAIVGVETRHMAAFKYPPINQFFVESLSQYIGKLRNAVARRTSQCVVWKIILKISSDTFGAIGLKKIALSSFKMHGRLRQYCIFSAASVYSN